MAISRMDMERQLRAGGGIMTLEEPRQGYFLGKIVKKAKRAVKKVTKSPLGKLALLGAGLYGLGGAKFLGGKGIFAGGQGLARFKNLASPFLSGGKLSTIGDVFRVGGEAGKDFSALRLLGGGLGAAAVAAPFLMGGDEEEVDEESFTGPISSVESIRDQARNYYKDPTNSALYFMPQEKFIRPFANGGLAGLDTPKRGMVDGPGSYAGFRLMDEGNINNRRPRTKFDFLKETGPISESDIKLLENLSEEDLEELKKIKGPFFMEFLEDILKIPYIMRGGDVESVDSFANGGLASMRPGYRIGGGVLQKAGQMIKAGVGKVKSLFDDADINVSIRDEDVMTDAGLQAQAVGQDVFITPKSNKAVQVMEELIDEGYDIAKAEDGSYAISSVDEGALDIITQRLRIGSKGADEFIQSQDYYGGPIDEESKMIYDALRNRKAEGGLMDLGGLEKDYREGGFVPIGEYERKDDVPARLSKNEFVFTADAVRGAGGGDINTGAKRMYQSMKQLEQMGKRA